MLLSPYFKSSFLRNLTKFYEIEYIQFEWNMYPNELIQPDFAREIFLYNSTKIYRSVSDFSLDVFGHCKESTKLK